MGMLLRRHRKPVAVEKTTATENEDLITEPVTKESIIEETTENGVEEHLTKTDIGKMNKEALVSLAKENGIKDTGKYTNAELKKLLIKKLGI